MWLLLPSSLLPQQWNLQGKSIPAFMLKLYQSEVKSSSALGENSLGVTDWGGQSFLCSPKDFMVMSFDCFLWSEFREEWSHPFKEKPLDFQTICQWSEEFGHHCSRNSFYQVLSRGTRSRRNRGPSTCELQCRGTVLQLCHHSGLWIST